MLTYCQLNHWEHSSWIWIELFSKHCQNGNIQCSRWRQFHQNNKISVAVHIAARCIYAHCHWTTHEVTGIAMQQVLAYTQSLIENGIWIIHSSMNYSIALHGAHYLCTYVSIFMYLGVGIKSTSLGFADALKLLSQGNVQTCDSYYITNIQWN